MNPVRINLGCGTNKLSGFQNYDAELDIRKPLPFAAESVDFILIEHCLEHVNGPDGFRFLKEAYRVLKPNGVLRVCVPQLKKLPRDEREDIITNHGHLQIYNAELLYDYLTTAGFDRNRILLTPWRPIDGHWKVIGREKDDRETLRVEAQK